MNQALLAARLLFSSLSLCLEYQNHLDLSNREFVHWVKKTFNLGWCYAAFAPANHRSLVRCATQAAFASATYDVLTDWRGISAQNRRTLYRVLREFAPLPLCDLAIELYDKEMLGRLEPHGLDRGVDALRFVLGVFGVSPRDSTDFDVVPAGYALQAIDDLLDYEADTESGNINFLNTPCAADILAQLNGWLSKLPTSDWCRRSFAFRIAFHRAMVKADTMRHHRLTLHCVNGSSNAL